MRKQKQKQYRAISLAIKNNIVGAEIGTHKGDMSRALFKLIPGLNLIMVDRWEPYPESERENLPLSDIAQIDDQEKWDKIKAKVKKIADSHPGSSMIQADGVEAAEQVKDRYLDFVFFDASRDYELAKKEIAAWIPKLKNGGLIMGYHTKRFPYDGLLKAARDFGDVYIFDQLFWLVKIEDKKI